ncbi:hypothetical protein P43SY_010454 [Pythium insidiosum]|uniref:Xylose isomerase-like TIM barrel domain-containing protein n=1 Tax=Pythium insidiosum TaxID=114742 RepID=A0AAD5M2U7_PYTIN|nr:hypothetical protein P43SY_010454 [Pythium insidiosum]
MATAALRLQAFRSLWGTPSAARLGVATAPAAAYGDKLLARIKAQGYDGIEASLSDLELLGGARVVNELLAKHDLQLIVGVYSGWTDYEDRNLHEHFDGVSQHLDRLRRQLDLALDQYGDASPSSSSSSSSPSRLAWINAHSGTDHWNKLDQMEYVAHALEIESELELDILSHETHRGRLFYSPWPTLELLDAFPSLKLSLDFSHWCVVTERLLDTEFDERWIRRVLPFVHHVHGRVGTAQRPQIAVMPGHPAAQHEVDRFERLWESVWAAQLARSQFAQATERKGSRVRGGVSTFTPEYGPVPYAPRDVANPEADGYDVDAVCELQMARQRKQFARFLAERTTASDA